MTNYIDKCFFCNLSISAINVFPDIEQIYYHSTDYTYASGNSSCILFKSILCPKKYSALFELRHLSFNIDNRVVVITNDMDLASGYSSNCFYICTNSIEESLIKIKNIQLLE